MAANRKANKDYNNSKIYCIRNAVDDEIYVGSTTQALCKRMAVHRANSKREELGNCLLYQKMKEFDKDEIFIELIEEYPCDNAEQLKKKEGEHIRRIGTLNNRIAGRTRKEHYCNDRDKSNEISKAYHQQTRKK